VHLLEGTVLFENLRFQILEFAFVPKVVTQHQLVVISQARPVLGKVEIFVCYKRKLSTRHVRLVFLDLHNMAFLPQLRTTTFNRLTLPTTTRRTFAISSTAMASRISDTIKRDHREIESFYDQVINATDETEKTKWQNQFTWELARHSIGEELVVYPAFEKYVSGGAELANKDRRDHQAVRPHPHGF